MGYNLLGWLLSAIVLLLLFGIGAVLKNPARLMLTGKKAQGIVVGMDTNDRMLSPIVQFVTAAGEKVKVTGNNYSESTSVQPGDHVTVVYDPKGSHDAYLLLWKEFTVVGVLLGFIIFILLVWICGLLLAPDIDFGDPLHILASVISGMKLSPVRFPMYVMLPIVIFSCGLGSYVTFKSAHDLSANGIRVIGHVSGSRTESAHLSDGSRTVNGNFAMVAFTDQSGNVHEIKRSLAKPYSRLKDGDEVEVIYPGDHPDLGVVNTWDEMWLLPCFFGFVFIAFVMLAWLLLSGRQQLI